LSFGLQVHLTSSSSVIVAYSDVDRVGSKDSCHSTIGYVVFFGPNLIFWCSKKHPTISKSFIEAGYQAIVYTVTENFWNYKLLFVLGI